MLGFHSFTELTEHIKTRIDDSHAPPEDLFQDFGLKKDVIQKSPPPEGPGKNDPTTVGKM